MGLTRSTAFYPPKATSGDWILPMYSASAAFNFANGTLNMLPIDLPPISITGLSVEVTVVGSVGSVARLVAYSDTGLNRPGNLLVDGGTVAATSTGFLTVSFAAVRHGGGRLWVGAVNQGAPATTATFRYATALVGPLAQPTQSSSLSFAFVLAGVTGAAPSSASAGSINAAAGAPIVRVQAA